MRRRLFAFLFLAVSLSFAADLTVKVADPQGAAVPRARVAAYREHGTAAVTVALTSSEGAVRLQLAPGSYRLHVLAPGFAEQTSTVIVPASEAVTVSLHVASTPETVNVTAALTPLTAEQSATATETLTAGQLLDMQPVEAADALRFTPGVVINSAGRRGGIASMFVRGGDSRYNKVVVDGVTINDPGGTVDLGVVPLDDIDRIEMARGAESTLYGSDAMTSATQMFTRIGTTRVPEFRFGADGGNFGTARGYASLAGARGLFDYNVFGQQFNTSGQGVNDDYSNSSQGANLGFRLAPRVSLRLHARHSNSRSGVQSFWNFNGQPLVPPDTDQYARQNNFLGSAELTIASPSRWIHHLTTFDYNHHRRNVDTISQPGRESVYGNFDTPFDTIANINRAGVQYEGEYWASDWARTTFGYRFEDENGWVGDRLAPTHGLRRNHAVFAQQIITWRRLSLVGGMRLEHNESFGNKGVPRIAGSVLALRGGNVFSGTRFRAAWGLGIKEPRLEETFAHDAYTIPNPFLKAEENRSFEAGVQQNLFGTKAVLAATYYRNDFRNQINYATVDPVNFIGQYQNVDRSFAHGAELTLHARATNHVGVQGGYVYTATQILSSPYAFDPLLAAGQPFPRRPKHSGSLLGTWTGSKWGGELGLTAVGPRPDSDFMGLTPHVTHAAGYARVDFGAWHAINHRMTMYANVENALNRHYEEVAGYPALRLNFRAGMRFRLGGE